MLGGILEWKKDISAKTSEMQIKSEVYFMEQNQGGVLGLITGLWSWKIYPLKEAGRRAHSNSLSSFYKSRVYTSKKFQSKFKTSHWEQSPIVEELAQLHKQKHFHLDHASSFLSFYLAS